jgi:ElaB/YqjD/DUF883 family membrane-anchored ribosome-binding protein
VTGRCRFRSSKENEPGQVDAAEGSEQQPFAERIKSIVADGSDVRSKIADAVRQAAAMIHETGQSLGDVSKSVIDEAVGAASDEAESGTVLREVIDGVGDGFGSAAQAVDLAVAEARTKGHEFAKDELHTVANDLRGLSELLVETTGRALRGAGGFVKEQASDLTAHAERTAKRVKPDLESAASAATGDLGGTIKQAARAGASAARQGSGTLIAIMGGLLQKTGDALKLDDAGAEETQDDDPVSG